MDIILGKMAGFCPGITNAVKNAEKIVEENKGKKTYCLGELTHNRQVMDKLENRGLTVVDSIEEINDNNKLIIRAHGIKKDVYKKAREKQINLLDLTCIKVLNIHKMVSDYEKRGFYIILLGEKEHPEIMGTYSFCGKNSCIVENLEDIDEAIVKCKQSKINNVAIVSQTTFSMKKFDIIVNLVKDKLPKDINLEVNKTICEATKLRQEETEKIAGQVDFMIIIGGKNSSNTKKLYDISRRKCNNAIMIQTKNDIDIEKLKGVSKVGVMAGASTPKESIDGVIDFLKNL